MKSIKEILSEMANIEMRLSIINFKAMSICQQLGFNGFKRWHRCFSKDFYNFVICLETKAFDYYAVDLDLTGDLVDYKASSIIYHFQLYKEQAEKALAELGTLNKDFYELTGFEAPKADKTKKILLKQIEKCTRMINRYKSIGSEATGLHDLHTYDDRLHEKMKKIEEEHYARH
jgi:hypothetical protein